MKVPEWLVAALLAIFVLPLTITILMLLIWYVKWLADIIGLDL